MKPAYYNEIDPYAAEWLRNLIKAGHIPAGDVDDRSIIDVAPSDLAGYGQCHFFAGIGGFGFACRLAGIPDDASIWTGGFPCQPFSVAGRQLAQEDDRHLWPVLSRLIEQARPSTFIGENVAGIIDLALDGVLFDLESAGYASRAFVVPACAVNAPHRRDRVWIAARNMADAAGQGRLPASLAGIHGGETGAGARHGEPERRGGGGDGLMADADCKLHDGGGNARQGRGSEPANGGERHGLMADADCATGRQDAKGTLGDEEAHGRAGRVERQQDGDNRSSGNGEGLLPMVNADCGGRAPGQPAAASVGYRRAAVAAGGGAGCEFWDGARYLPGADGKARRVEPGIRLLAHGIPSRVAKLRAGGNAIVPQVAAEIIRAAMGGQPS